MPANAGQRSPIPSLGPSYRDQSPCCNRRLKLLPFISLVSTFLLVSYVFTWALHDYTLANLQPFPGDEDYLSPASAKTDDSKDARRIYTQPPLPFPEEKAAGGAASARSKPALLKAFMRQGFQFAPNHKDAHFLMGEYFYKKMRTSPNINSLKPWQRPNWTPGISWMFNKDKILTFIEEGEHDIPFFPESYRLCNERSKDKFLKRLKEGGGMNEAWLMKPSDGLRSRGIQILGPNSSELLNLQNTLSASNGLSSLCRRNNIVQKYVENLLTYRGRKFLIRAFFPVVSVDPLVVYYHDGYLHVSLFDYNATDFSGNIEQHFTGKARHLDSGKPLTEEVDATDVSIEADFRQYLGQYVAKELPHLSSSIPDPLLHIRNQMKAAMAQLVGIFRRKTFTTEGFLPENAFIMMGNDFFVDRDLRVWFTEANCFPNVGGQTKVQKKNNQVLLHEFVDLVSEVYEKQLKGEVVLPLQRVKIFDLVYTDNFHFTYPAFNVGHDAAKDK